MLSVSLLIFQFYAAKLLKIVGKCKFLQKKHKKIWSIQKKAVPLHPLSSERVNVALSREVP